MDEDNIKKSIERMGLSMLDKNKEKYHISVPFYRTDILH